uniref:Osiris 20 n=1 Tax=Timema poppense TaxID=170557 RepID=A0A7R9D0Y5_TIMPO|nr:unnamed protein product [Timema poppensis]
MITTVTRYNNVRHSYYACDTLESNTEPYTSPRRVCGGIQEPLVTHRRPPVPRPDYLPTTRRNKSIEPEAILVGVLLGCLIATVASAQESAQDNEILSSDSRKIQNGKELLESVVNDCFLSGSGSSMTCLRMKVLSYLDSVGETQSGRSADEERSDVERLDDIILSRVTRYLKSHQFKVKLPEFLFQEAVLTFRPSRGLADFKVDFPKDDENEDRALSQGINDAISDLLERLIIARGMIKKKLLLPVLLLLKMTLKALTPIFVAIIGLKAMKALILSKVAILLVVGFLVMQLCKKAGMQMPMPVPMTIEPTPYSAPAPAPAPPASSYEPGWDSSASSGGPYSRVWDPHQMAYSAYYSGNQQQQAQTSTSQSSPQQSQTQF